MRFWTKKRAAAIGLAVVMTISLTACGEKDPSLEEVEQAIEAGTLTVEDALDKGWVDQAWVDGYIEANSVPAGDKMEANKVEDFTTSTLDGMEFTKADLGGVVFFTFADPASEGVQEFYNALAQAHEGVTANGAGIVLCTKSEEGNELFADAPFPVILYNDSLKAAVGKNSGMIEDEEILNTASWYVNGSFYSSWSLKVDAEDLVEDAAAFVEMSQDKELSGADSADSGAAGMVPMG